MKPKSKPKRIGMFSRWRLLAQDGSRRFAVDSDGVCAVNRPGPNNTLGTYGKLPAFDELVVGVGTESLHIERMDSQHLWMGIGNVDFAIWRDRRTGKACVRLTEGVYDPATGDIHPHGWRPKRAKK